MSYNILKYATLSLGMFLLASGLFKAHFEVSEERQTYDSTEVVRQHTTVVNDSLPQSKEHMLQTSYLSQP